jgi:hypothetical protein
MGAWGYGIRQDDLVCDVIGVFEDLLKAGKSVREATEGVKSKFTGAMKDPDDGPAGLFPFRDNPIDAFSLFEELDRVVSFELGDGRPGDEFIQL